MSVKLDKQIDEQPEKRQSWLRRNQWVITLAVFILVPVLLFKGYSALRADIKEKSEAREQRAEERKAEREAKKEAKEQERLKAAEVVKER